MRQVSEPTISPKAASNRYYLRFDFVGEDIREWITKPLTPEQWAEMVVDKLKEEVFPIIVEGGQEEVGGTDYFEYDNLLVTKETLSNPNLLLSWGIRHEG